MHIPIAKKYVLGIFFKYLMLALGIFTGLMMMVNFMQLVQSGALSGFSLYFLIKSILYMIPNVIGMCMPISFMLALLLSLGQMSQDGEIIALRAGGYSFFDIFSWVFIASCLLSLLLLYINNIAGPHGLSKSKDYAMIMLQRISHVELKPRTFQKLSEWSLYAQDVNAITGQMSGVKLMQRSDKDGSASVMLMNAGTGWYRSAGDKGMLVQLYNGQFMQTESKSSGNVINGSFDSYETVLNFFAEGKERKRKKDELTSFELVRQSNAGILDAEDTVTYKCEAVSRIALSFGPLLFFLIGAPLGVALDKRGKSASFVFSLIILFFYYGFSIGSMMFTRNNMSFYPWALFVPALLALGAGLFLWRVRLSSK